MKTINTQNNKICLPPGDGEGVIFLWGLKDKMVKILKKSKIPVGAGILICFLLLCASGPTSAQDTTSITFSDFGLGDQTIIIYSVNGTLIEEVNSTSTVTLNSSLDYVFVLQPTKMNLFNNPIQAVDLVIAYIPAGFSWILVFVIGAGFLLLLRKVLR